jgi:hypothetical protein
MVTDLHRSVVRSAVHANHRNRRVSFKSGVKESLKLLDNKPSLRFIWKDSHHKHKSRNTNNDVSNRTKSKADYIDQHIGSRTRSKMHNINVNNLSVQNLFFFFCMMQINFKDMESLKHKICNLEYWNAKFIIMSY